LLELDVAVLRVNDRLKLALDVTGEEAESVLLTEIVLELVLLLFPNDEVVATLLDMYVLEIVMLLLLNEEKVAILLGADEGSKLLVE
jgi:hypothetical protein